MKLKELILNCPKQYENLEVNNITDDSRKVNAGDLFVCINGPVADGHNYAKAAVQNGAALVISERDLGLENQIIVDDTHKVFASICGNWFNNPQNKLKVIGVTGTNGKTTVSNMLTDILEAEGVRVMSNRAGSNITSGVSTAFIRNCDLFGRVKKCDMAVLEVDERASVRIFPYIKPNFVVITNLFRDSIMRNAHPYFIADILSRAIPADATMILNADDLISSGVAKENKRVYFGIDRMDSDVQACINLIDDVRICPQCSGKLDYAFRRYHHIGQAVCRDCGFRSPEAQYLAQNVDFAAKTMTIREAGESYSYPLITDSIFNVYNMVTVIAVLREMGYTHEKIFAAMKKSAIVASRHNEEQVGDVTLVMQMAKEKNALACSRAFDYVSSRSGEKELMLMMNCLGDAKHWSENVS